MNTNISKKIPLMEKYRPNKLCDIIFDKYNKILLNNIISTGNFPNLLLYGPPGTGKTTTIINLVKEYQKKYSNLNSENIIHLNASDERGVDIIRNQINTFINSSSLFNIGTKFIILDEVDYMTKIAQQSLKQILQNEYTDVVFCLMCNYISRIDDGLMNELIQIRFNQLPENDIVNLINNIIKNENIIYSELKIKQLIQLYNSDIRSIINYIHLNQYNNVEHEQDILFIYDIFNIFILMIQEKDNINTINKYIINQCKLNNINHKFFFSSFFNYLIQNNTKYITSEILYIIENILHNNTYIETDIYINHIITQLYDVL
jgi:replication factor C subunit 3/5